MPVVEPFVHRLSEGDRAPIIERFEFGGRGDSPIVEPWEIGRLLDRFRRLRRRDAGRLLIAAQTLSRT
jgi:hypothetical protein